MAILLRWEHRNSGSFTTKIFRSETEFTSATKPTNPIVTLTNDETTWSDNSVELGKYYYYLIQISRDSIVLDSQVRQLRETIESPWGTVTNDSLQDSVLGGDYNFGYAGTASWDSLYDNAGEEILRRCGTTADYRGTYDRLVIAGRYFLVPTTAVYVKPSLMIANNMFLGHRKVQMPAGLPAGSLGTNDPFIWKGRKWSVGFPKYKNEAGVIPTSQINAGTLKDTNGFCTMKYLSQWEVISFLNNTFLIADYRSQLLPKEVGMNRSAYSTSNAIYACDPHTNAVPGSITCYSVYENNTTVGENTYSASSAGTFAAYPFIEYLGVA